MTKALERLRKKSRGINVEWVVEDLKEKVQKQ